MWGYSLLLVGLLLVGCTSPTEPEPASCEWHWVQNDVQGTGIDSLAFCIGMR